MSKNSKIIISIISVILVAVLGSVFVNLGMDWFNGLDKPSQWISNIVIPIMWTIIYLTSAVVLYKWNKKGEVPKVVEILFIINGILNVLWCLTFFTLNLTFIGNIVIALNLIAGILLWTQIYKFEKVYSYFLSIYPIWLSLATTLNLALWILN